MKIAIQGHPTRGKEVIQILRSLGATSYDIYDTCSNPEWYWYINKNKEITCDPKRSMCGYKLYTLEEFETQFPFKVGDKVIHKEFNDFFEVISFNPESSYPYKIKGVCEFNTKSYILTKWQPKMKEERFVTLTLNKAKELYKKGGELKEIALQAFTEKELTKVDLPKSWEEFCENCPIKKGESYIDDFSDTECFITGGDNRNSVQDKNVCPSNKSAEAHLAMIQLEQLRDCYRQGDIPDFTKETTKYCIVKINKRIDIVESFYTSFFLSFTKKEVAEEYLKNFKPLIEKAEDLI